MTPFQVFASAVAIASFGGLAALLRSNQPITSRSILSATVYSGMAGLIIALLWYNNYGAGDPYFLLGVCGLAGIGGIDVLTFGVEIVQKGAVFAKGGGATNYKSYRGDSDVVSK